MSTTTVTLFSIPALSVTKVQPALGHHHLRDWVLLEGVWDLSVGLEDLLEGIWDLSVGPWDMLKEVWDSLEVAWSPGLETAWEIICV